VQVADAVSRGFAIFDRRVVVKLTETCLAASLLLRAHRDCLGPLCVQIAFAASAAFATGKACVTAAVAAVVVVLEIAVSAVDTSHESKLVYEINTFSN